MGGLIQRLQAGDRTAQQEANRLVRTFARKICRGGGPSGAIDWEDVAQESLRKLYAVGLQQYRGAGSSKSYLYSIVKATVIQMARSSSRQQVREDTAMALPPNPGVQPNDSMDVRLVLRTLDPACRDLITKIFFLDVSSADLARTLGLTESSVRVRLSRCLGKARRIATKERP